MEQIQKIPTINCENCGKLPTLFCLNDRPGYIITKCQCGKIDAINIFIFVNSYPRKIKYEEILKKAKDLDIKNPNSNPSSNDNLKEQILKFTDIAKNCEMDNKNTITHFCFTCFKHLCNSCFEKEHKEHQVMNLVDYLPKGDFDDIIARFEKAIIKVNVAHPAIAKGINEQIIEHLKQFDELSKKDPKNMSETELGELMIFMANKGEIVANFKKMQKGIEDALKISLLANNALLNFFAILLDIFMVSFQYRNFQVLRNIIINSEFNLNIPKFNAKELNITLKEVVEYLNDDLIIGKNVKKRANNRTIRVEELIEVSYEKKLTNHHTPVNCLIVLKDGRLLSCSNDNRIKVFSNTPKDKYEFTTDVTIKEHRGQIKYLCELFDGKICSISSIGTIKIWWILEKKMGLFEKILNSRYKCENTIELLHEDLVKIIPINMKKFGVCTESGKLYVYSAMSPYQAIYTFTVKSGFYNVIQLNPSDQLLSSHQDHIIRFWDCNKYFLESKCIKNVDSISPNGILQVETDRIIIGEDFRILLYDIENLNILFEFTYENFKSFDNLCMLSNGMILCSGESSNGNQELFYFDAEISKMKKRITGGTMSINSIVCLKDNIIACCSDDTSISLFSFK